MTALRLTDLSVRFGAQTVVSKVDLEVGDGSSLGIVGESGSGKSVTLRSIMGLLPASAQVTSGRLWIGDTEIPLAGRGLRAGRRQRLAMVFQDPLAALNPVMRVGAQIAEVPRRVFGESRHRSREITLELLRLVRIPDPERCAGAYPHELSGGQRQRAVIAMALACRPEVLLCDEPTTALDVTVQAAVLRLLEEVRERTGVALVFVTHDLAVISQVARDLVVMRRGEIVEVGPTATVLTRPRAPYTRALLDAVIELPETPAADVSDAPPRSLSEPAPSALVQDVPEPCPEVMPGDEAGPTEPHSAFQVSPADLGGVRAMGVTVTFPAGGRVVRAVDRVDLEVGQGRIHGLVGESGSGKTTLARVLTGQRAPDTGTVQLHGHELAGRRSVEQLRAIQMVYQDPYSSLDPRMTVRQTLAELVRGHRLAPRTRVEARCAELLDLVAMPRSALDGYPGQFSGGQRQRIAIARALAVEPRVLVADEPTSALDVSVQAAVLDLLVGLRDELGLAILVISHNLAVVRHICDDVSVMYRGSIVEAGPAARVLDRPTHDYTRKLIEAVPRLRKEPIT